MIKSFRCKETQKLFETGRSKRFGSIAKVATRKLAQLDAAETLEFLRSPPGNRLEELKGDRTASTASASMISGAFAFDGPRLDRQTLRSWITTEEHRVMAFKNGMRPVHPGEVLREEYLIPLGMSVNALAKALGVPTPRINDVVREKRGITPDTAMRLARYFGGDARSWLNLQIAYDLRIAEIASAKSIARSVAPMKKASRSRHSVGRRRQLSRPEWELLFALTLRRSIGSCRLRRNPRQWAHPLGPACT